MASVLDSDLHHIIIACKAYSNLAGFGVLNSIIKNIHNDSDAKAVTKAIAYFAENLGIKTVAEFVHSEEVMQAITEIGIDYAQGYLISEPKPSTH